jgi:hypothetical protein
MSVVLGIISIGFAICSSFLYVYQLLTAEKRLSISTWTISSIVLVINAFVFHDLTASLWYESGNVIVVAGSVVFVTIWSFFTGKLTRVGVLDFVAMFGSLGIGYFWYTGGDTAVASGALVVVCCISLGMTVLGLLRGDLKDQPGAWWLTFVSTVFQMGGDRDESGGLCLVQVYVSGRDWTRGQWWCRFDDSSL